LFLLNRAPFDVKKEAAFALANIGSERNYLDRLLDAGVVPQFVLLLNVPDEEVVTLALAFLSTIVQSHQEGAILLEEENAIEAIERLQYHTNEQLAKAANKLADTYYQQITSDNFSVDAEEEDLDADMSTESYPPWRNPSGLAL